MPTIVVFAELESPQRVLSVTGASVNEGPWNDSGRTDFVVNPDLSALKGIVPREFWKHDGGLIVEWTQAEKDAKAVADAADQAAQDAARLVSIRTEAAGGLDEFEVNSLLMRAFADIIKDEINTLRALHSLPDRTLAQLRTAITNRVNDGKVDS